MIQCPSFEYLFTILLHSNYFLTIGILYHVSTYVNLYAFQYGIFIITKSPNFYQMFKKNVKCYKTVFV